MMKHAFRLAYTCWWLAALGFVYVGVELITSYAQPAPPPQPDATVRALQATVSEVTQAWIMSRSSMLAAQDQIASLEKQLAEVQKARGDCEGKAANAIPDPTKK